jgi:hypothetical protein
MNSITDESLRNLLSAAITQNENMLTREDYDK